VTAGWLALCLLAQAASATPEAMGSPSGLTAGSSAAPAAGQGPVTVAAVPSKAEVELGEVFALEVRASGPAGTTYAFPAEISDETVDLRTAAHDPRGAEPPPGVHRYQASVFSLNRAQIPPIAVRYRLPDGKTGEAASAAVDLKVASVLPKDAQQQKPADIRGPLSVSIGPAFWVALAATALGVGALAVWLLRRRRRGRAPVVPAAPPVPPGAEALQALDALAASGLLAGGEYRAFYIELAIVVKRYLERRLEAPVLEMTTAEMLALLRGHPSADDLLATIRDVAGAADRIKFARGEGLRAEGERHLAAARQVIVTLEDRLRPRPPLAAAGEAA
jgi:hypothetical protein